MSRNEILSTVRFICSGIPDNDAIDKLLDNLEAALPNSDICDLIFQDKRNLTPEQVVDEAMQQEVDYLASRPSNQ